MREIGVLLQLLEDLHAEFFAASSDAALSEIESNIAVVQSELDGLTLAPARTRRPNEQSLAA
jgi:hypothetical protein